MIDVCLLGTGGMMPLPRRALTSLMLRYNGSSILIDCGEGTQVSIREQGWSFKPIDVICFTHYHADHISGLPGLLLTLGNAERTKPLLLIGPKKLEKTVNALRMIAPELPFPIEFKELESDQETISFGDLAIDAFRVNHNVTCYGYRVRLARAGKFDREKALANDIPMKCWSILQKGTTVTDGDKIYTPDMVLGKERKGLSVTYCTDTRPVPIIAEYAKNADLFICEGMYGEDGKEVKAREYKHMTFYEAAEIAKKAEPREMWLTHYSPSLVNPEMYMEKVRSIYPAVKTGKDRMTKELLFEEE